MYKLHLILKYLRKRRIAWVALVAVMLCTTMVLVVISVMGGWLAMFRESFHRMSGDIVVTGESVVGFPHYQRMIDQIRRDVPEVKAASPVIRTMGLVYLNNGFSEIRRGAEVYGFQPNIVEVNGFGTSLNLQKGTQQLSFGLLADLPYQRIAPPGSGDVTRWEGLIAGSSIVSVGKDQTGTLNRPRWLNEIWGRLSLLPISPYGKTADVKDKAEMSFWVVDDSRTQTYQYDANSVYVSFDTLQKLLNMDARSYIDADTNREMTELARTNEIQIALKPGTDLLAAKKKIAAIVYRIRDEQELQFQFPLKVQTWEEVNSKWLGAIENEKVLVTFLFGIISLVAVFLIFCIFYMIVVEKTRDIGIIRSVGAPSGGVAGMFLGYGAAIGIVGSLLGFVLAYLIVTNINQLHTWLGQVMGVQIWNPEVYLFDRIPDRMNGSEVAVILLVAVIASIVGALVPASRAGTMRPVDSLRWE